MRGGIAARGRFDKEGSGLFANLSHYGRIAARGRGDNESSLLFAKLSFVGWGIVVRGQG
jgi:hypothetical protein